MAAYLAIGLDEFIKTMSEMAKAPEETQQDILYAMGERALSAEKETGESMGVRDEESGQHILDKIKLTKPKKNKNGVWSISVTFGGTRTDEKHKRPTRNAEIAFINEFGKQNQPARPFIKTALEVHGEEITRAGEKVWNEYIDRKTR